jgi:hypothetical protein
MKKLSNDKNASVLGKRRYPFKASILIFTTLYGMYQDISLEGAIDFGAMSSARSTLYHLSYYRSEIPIVK